MLACFDRAAEGALETVLVSGYSGVGKSSLVQEVHKPIVARRGNFISGKFDQYQRNKPYLAIAQAFNELSEYLVSNPEEELLEWKRKILNVLGDEARVIIEIIPRLELVLGKQPPVSELGPMETQNRLIGLFEKFVGVVCQKEHPLTLFIDDVQWVDMGSLLLLENLINNSQSQYLLLICAFRDNEVDPLHPFITTISEARKKNIWITNINLKPLQVNDICHLVSDSLSCEFKAAAALAKLIYDKTRGNSFFVGRFFKSLNEKKLLFYSHEKRKWLWDLEKIKTRNVTDNVVELMTQKINGLEANTIQIMRLGSCLGNKFNINILAIIYEKSVSACLRDLWQALEEGLILPLDDNYKLFGTNRDEPDETDSLQETQYIDILKSEFCFVHDRVQEAAYATIKDEQKKEVHIQIARLLHFNSDETELEERIFDLVSHYQKGVELLKEKREKIQVAGLCLKASNKAINSSAFKSALNYATFAVEHLLDANSWEEYYDLTWSLYRNKANSEFNAVQHEESEKTILIALEKSRTRYHKVSIYQLYLRVLFQMNRHHEGINTSRAALSYLGVKLPGKIKKVNLAKQYIKFRIRLGFRTPESLMDLPENKNPLVLDICRILYESIESSYIVHPDTMAYNSLLMANICLKNGNSIYAPAAYAILSIVMTGITKELKMANRFARMSIQLNKQKYPDQDIKGRVHLLTSNWSHHWINPIKDHLALARIALQCTLNVGLLHWANYSLFFNRPQNLFFNPGSLNDIINENLAAAELFLNSGDREVVLQQTHFLNYLYWLKGEKREFENDKIPYDRKDYAEEMAGPGNLTIQNYYYTVEMIQAYTIENYDTAMKYARHCSSIALENMGNLIDFPLKFYYVLVALRFNPKKESRRYSYKFSRFMIGYYARRNPSEFMAYELLLQAEERDVIEKGEASDLYLYEQAIEESEKTEYMHLQALANELYAKYLIKKNRKKYARLHMVEARYLYKQWGAKVKSESLERRYRKHSFPPRKLPEIPWIQEKESRIRWIWPVS